MKLYFFAARIYDFDGVSASQQQMLDCFCSIIFPSKKNPQMLYSNTDLLKVHADLGRQLDDLLHGPAGQLAGVWRRQLVDHAQDAGVHLLGRLGAPEISSSYHFKYRNIFKEKYFCETCVADFFLQLFPPVSPLKT